MIAVGLVLFCVGFFILRVQDTHYSITTADYFGSTIALVGCALMLAGAAKWLWMAAP